MTRPKTWAAFIQFLIGRFLFGIVSSLSAFLVPRQFSHKYDNFFCFIYFLQEDHFQEFRFFLFFMNLISVILGEEIILPIIFSYSAISLQEIVKKQKNSSKVLSNQLFDFLVSFYKEKLTISFSIFFKCILA